MATLDIGGRLQLIQHTVELNAPRDARWSVRRHAPEITSCDLCDGRITGDIATLKCFGDPYIIARMHRQCLEWFTFMQRGS